MTKFFTKCLGLFCLTALCFSLNSMAQPANDVCTGAIDIACGGSESGTTAGANNTGVSFCGTSNTSADVWYHFSATSCATVTASLCNSSYDTKISVFDGSCASLNCIGGNDDNFSACGSGGRSEFSWSPVVGQDYYILVHGWSSNAGNYTLDLTCPTGGCTDPTADNFDACASTDDGSCFFNDLCGGAETIECGDTKTGDTSIATSDSAPFCGTSDGTGGGVWYQFTGTGGAITASLCGSSFDTKLRVYTGTCGALVCEIGNDDNFAACSSSRSEVTFTSVQCTEYYILVHGFGSSAGAFQLDLTCAGGVAVTDLGCTDPTAHNYDATACNDDGSCETCTDGILNGDEIAMDCGGSLCNPCPCGIQVETEVVVYESGCEAGPKNRVAIVTFTDGIPPMSYAIDAQGSSFISQKAPGVFQVIGYGPWSIEASDPSGCLQIGASGDMAYVSDTEAAKETAVNAGDGSATVEVTGGTPPYSVVWSDGTQGSIAASGGTHDNTGLVSGYYEAVVTDASAGTAKACIYVGREASGGGRGRGRKAADVTDLSTLMAQPNPLTSSTMIHFNVPESTKTTVSVFALNGKEIATIFDGQAEAGENYHVELNASKMASGVYILRLTTDSGMVSHQRIVVTK